MTDSAYTISLPSRPASKFGGHLTILNRTGNHFDTHGQWITPRKEYYNVDFEDDYTVQELRDALCAHTSWSPERIVFFHHRLGVFLKNEESLGHLQSYVIEVQDSDNKTRLYKNVPNCTVPT